MLFVRYFIVRLAVRTYDRLMQRIDVLDHLKKRNCQMSVKEAQFDSPRRRASTRVNAESHFTGNANCSVTKSVNTTKIEFRSVGAK